MVLFFLLYCMLQYFFSGRNRIMLKANFQAGKMPRIKFLFSTKIFDLKSLVSKHNDGSSTYNVVNNEITHLCVLYGKK